MQQQQQQQQQLPSSSSPPLPSPTALPPPEAATHTSDMTEFIHPRPVETKLLVSAHRSPCSLPSATLLLSTGTGRGSLPPGSSGWTPVWTAGSSRSRAGCAGLRPGRTPLAAGRRPHTLRNTGSRTDKSFKKSLQHFFSLSLTFLFYCMSNSQLISFCDSRDKQWTTWI